MGKKSGLFTKNRTWLLTLTVLVLFQLTVSSQDDLLILNRPDSISYFDPTILISGTYAISVNQTDSINIFRSARMRIEKDIYVPSTTQIIHTDSTKIKIIYLFDTDTEKKEQFQLLYDSLPLQNFDSLSTILWNEKTAEEIAKNIQTTQQSSNILILALTHKSAKKIKKLNKYLSSNNAKGSVLLGILHFNRQEAGRDLKHQLGNNIVFDIGFAHFLNQPRSVSHYLNRINHLRYYIFLDYVKINVKEERQKFQFAIEFPAKQYKNRHWILMLNKTASIETPYKGIYDPTNAVVEKKISVVDTLMSFYIFQGYPWKAVRLGFDSLRFIKDKQVSSTITKRLRFLVDSLCRTSARYDNCDSLYHLFTGKYSKQAFNSVKHSFFNRLQFAKCCEIKNDYQRAYENYEWIISHWKEKQQLITWEKGLNKLQDYQFKTFRFDESVNLNERLIGEFNDQKAINRATVGIIAKYTFPAAKILAIYLQHRWDPHQVQTSLTDQLLRIPQYIESIYVANSNHKVSDILYGTPGPSTVKKVRIGSGDKVTLIDQSVYAIGKINKNKYLVIKSAVYMGKDEELIYREIKQRNQPGKAWLKFKNVTFNSGIRLLSQLIAKFLTLELTYDILAEIKPYWDAFEPGKWVKYMATFNGEGGMNQNISYNKSEINYGRGDKSIPITSPIFYEQPAKYGGVSIVEISNPIFNGNKWHSTIKIGFKK